MALTSRCARFGSRGAGGGATHGAGHSTIEQSFLTYATYADSEGLRESCVCTTEEAMARIALTNVRQEEAARVFVRAGGEDKGQRHGHRIIKMPNGMHLSLPTGILREG